MFPFRVSALRATRYEEDHIYINLFSTGTPGEYFVFKIEGDSFYDASVEVLPLDAPTVAKTIKDVDSREITPEVRSFFDVRGGENVDMWSVQLRLIYTDVYKYVKETLADLLLVSHIMSSIDKDMQIMKPEHFFYWVQLNLASMGLRDSNFTDTTNYTERAIYGEESKYLPKSEFVELDDLYELMRSEVEARLTQ